MSILKPVFKEELDFLQINPQLEGVLWVDSRCYYGFNENYEKVKFGRALEKLPIDPNGLITHEKYCEYYYENHTKAKVELEKAKFEDYIKNTPYDEIIISVSGGKDSTVTHHMVYDIAKSVNKTRVLFGNTSNETHYTYKYVKDMYPDLEIANPKEGFYNWTLRTGIVPNRFTRSCCGVFKEGNIGEFLDDDKRTLQVCGIRKDESKNRSTYTQTMINSKWNKKQQANWMFYFPIIDFDDLDIWSYIIHNKINFNILYKFMYQRVGCTNCPYRSDYEIKANKYFLPTYYEKWQRILEEVFVRDGLAINMNCTLQEYLDGAWKAGLVREEPTQEVIEDFAKHKGIDLEQAKKYFKKNRCSCGKRLSKDVIGLNMKLLGRNTEGRMCLKCLAKFLETDVKSLKAQIEGFKAEGCNLF